MIHSADQLFPNPRFAFLYASSVKNEEVGCDGGSLERCFEYDPCESRIEPELEVVIRVVKDDSFRHSFYTKEIAAEVMGKLADWHLQGKTVNANEVIFGWMKQKPRIDIDQKGNTDSKLADSIAKKFAEQLIKLYKLDADDYMDVCIDVYDSSGETKLSRHLVARELCWANFREAKHFMEKFKSILSADEIAIVDFGIYNKTAGLRTLYSTKESRTKKLLTKGYDTATSTDWQLTDSLITYTQNCQLLPALTTPVREEEQTQANYMPGRLTAKSKAIVEKFAEENGLAMKITQNDTKIILDRLTTGHCKICDRSHDRVGGFVILKKYGIRYYCYRACAEDRSPAYITIYSIPKKTIYSPYHESTHRFFDIKKCKSIADVRKFIKLNIALIYDGGRPYFMTRMVKDCDICFNVVRSKDIAQLPDEWELPNADPTKKPSRVNLLTMIKSLSDKISYDWADFMPPHIGPVDNVFNTFTGFKHRPLDEYDPSIIKPVTQHIYEIWCRNDQDQYDYLMNLFAHIVQKPHIKTDTALIIKSSEQGAGKGVIVEFIGKHVIGSKYFYYTEKVGKLFDKFNSELANKILTLVDETSSFEMSSSSISEELKAYITRTKMWIEHKGMNKIELNDYNNYIFATNKDCPLYIDAHDRRFFVLDADNKYCKDKEYFVRLASLMTPEMGQHFFTMLMQRDISKFNPRVRPSTSAKNKMIEDSLPLHLKFLVDYVRTNRMTMTVLSMPSDDFYQEFDSWCRKSNIKNIPTKIGFCREVNKVIPCKVKKVNGRAVNLRHILICDLEKALKTSCNFDIDLKYAEVDDEADDSATLDI